MFDNVNTLIAICVIVVVLFAAVAAILSRYRKCPSDKIMVIYGKVGTDKNGQAKAQSVSTAVRLLSSPSSSPISILT